MSADERRIAIGVDIAALIVALLMILFVATDNAGPARTLLAVVFVTFVPGWTIVAYVDAVQGMSKIGLAIGLSLTIGIATATVALWVATWEPIFLFYVLGGASVVALAHHLAQMNVLQRRSEMHELQPRSIQGVVRR